MDAPTTIFSRKLNVGEDLIYKNTDGRDVMEAGETYLILSDKPITVQYGALFGNERDGGGYIPSSNGSSSGQLLYFGVPYQSGGEQEIRIVSWDDNNSINLERYNNGTWTAVKSYSLNKMQAGDWVGKNNGNVSYNTVFRVTCTAGKRVSVFEGNWFETGTPGTSDMGTMVSAENGTSSGTKFLTYMAPPGNEQNVRNPFTGTNFGQQLTHLYLFSKDGATVKVKDAYTNGQKFAKTYTIEAGRYADCFLTLAEWKSIYNGTGTSSGPERPYLLVESSDAISVMNTNFNDNWMCYVGSSLGQNFTQESSVSQSSAIPTDTVIVKSVISTGSEIENAKIEVVVQDGLKVIESNLVNESEKIKGDIEEKGNKTIVSFDSLNTLKPQTQYTVETQVVASVGGNSGNLTTTNTNTSVETVVTGTINNQIQQSSSTEVVNINPLNTSKLIFSKFEGEFVNKDSTDSWTASWTDINKDGFDDLFVSDKRPNKPNLIYINNKIGGFTRGQSLISDSAISMTHTWADVDNDGYEDVLVLNNTRKPSIFYHNEKGILVKDNSNAFTQSISYYHGGSFADYDNDGKVDLFMCNYFATKYNELHHNEGNGKFTKELSNVIPAEANQSVGASWADYDKDGFLDLFVPNGTGFKNSLFHNEGNGTFKKVMNVIGRDGGQSVGSCWGDYDNDGDLDLFVTNSNTLGNFLYRNEGNGDFTKITNSIVVKDRGNSHGCSFADIDNDGDLDLYVTNDKAFKFLYINDGKGEFTSKTDEVINFNFGNAFGQSWSDFDHDGDLDLFVATHSNQPNGFFINNGNNNNWIEISLEGVTSNKSAIGADIKVYSNGIWQLREVNSQSGFGGQSSLIQHFGLGGASKIDSIIVSWPSGVVQILTSQNANQILKIRETENTKLYGGVYIDANNNGKKDKDEDVAGRAVVQVNPGTSKIYCDNNGRFTTSLFKGVYSFNVVNDRGLKAQSDIPTKVDATSGKAISDTLWLPATVSCEASDLSIIMGSTAIRKGYTNNQFTMTAGNVGRKTVVGSELKFKAPATIIPSGFNTNFDYAEGTIEQGVAYKTYTWKLSNLEAFENRLFQFQHSNASSVNIGDTIQLSAWITSPEVDCNVSDNMLAQTYTVVGAIDPNDISVAPAGYGKEGYIQPTQVLTYTIRFQNIGNHVANSVNITDVLPDGIDVSTLKVMAQSHEGLSVVTKGQKVSFQFDDIYLSDSVSNKDGSQGFIVFSASPVKGIKAGTILRNKASIRFDNYEEMSTNEVLNTIQSKQQELSMLEVKAYPNPAMDVIYISLKHKMGKYSNKIISKVEMVDMSGRVLLTKNVNNNEEVRINLPEWFKGFYFIKVTDSENQVFVDKVMVVKPR
ncbi:MAG: VCBS repeat-containing protein [Chitinophagaceae bacterium]|nr:VCBS repeat-containing protein [Chitinophagaceae bacterium]